MSDQYAGEQVSNALLEGLDMVTSALSLGEAENDVADLVVNAIGFALRNPGKSFDEMIEAQGYETDPREWWDWS